MRRAAWRTALLLAAALFTAGFTAPVTAARPPPVHPRPLVGILAQPPWDATPPADLPGACQPPPVIGSYIAASYVKFVELAGARVVPIRFDAPHAELARLFRAVNALLLPGGAADVAGATSAYRIAGERLWGLAAAANAAGDYFALHGTCLGWEQLAVLAARNASALHRDAYDSPDDAAPLAWAPAAARSRLFGGAAAAPLRAALAAAPAAYESHSAGVPPAAFQAFPALRDAFAVLSTSVDRRGRAYVSTAEARQLPITATQVRRARGTPAALLCALADAPTRSGHSVCAAAVAP
jgi:gamma-glutamyl hydrolase